MTVFGGTGSIGLNALNLATLKTINIPALACGDHIGLLIALIAQFKPHFVSIKLSNV